MGYCVVPNPPVIAVREAVVADLSKYEFNLRNEIKIFGPQSCFMNIPCNGCWCLLGLVLPGNFGILEFHCGLTFIEWGDTQETLGYNANGKVLRVQS